MKKLLLFFILISVLQFNYKAQCPSLTVTPSFTICQNSNLLLTVSSSVACSYSWTGPNGFSTTIQNPTVSNVGVAASGNYTVVATFTSPSCQSSAIVNVSVIAVPTIALNPSITLCQYQSGSMNASAPNAINYLWTGPNSFSVNSPSAFLVNVMPSQSGNVYTVTATFTTGTFTCYSSNYTTLNVIPNNSISLNVSDTTICGNQGNPVFITATGANTYTWSTGPTTSSIVVTPTATTIYNVVGTNTVNGCTNSVNATVTVVNCSGVSEFADMNSTVSIFPNPNNGIFMIHITSESSIIITDILGKLIYDDRLEIGSNNINLNRIPDGVYFLKIMSDKNIRAVKFIKE